MNIPPANVIELSRPLSNMVRPRSHSADGNTYDIAEEENMLEKLAGNTANSNR